MSGDLAAFLTARLDEDEAMARAAMVEIEAWGGTWQEWTDSVWKRAEIDVDGIADQMERHGPARVLADVDAKRRIVRMDIVEVNRLLTLPYADHPDYRAEWRP